MPKAADPAWEEHTSETSKVVEKAGIDTTVKGWVCNHCGVKIWNRDLQRLLCHLSGDADRCKGERITACAKVEQDVRETGRPPVATLGDTSPRDYPSPNTIIASYFPPSYAET